MWSMYFTLLYNAILASSPKNALCVVIIWGSILWQVLLLSYEGFTELYIVTNSRTFFINGLLRLAAINFYTDVMW